MKSTELRQKFLKFFEERGHRIIPSTSLVPPENVELAPTQRVLFTTAGMHPLIPYLLGGPHPQGQRLVNIQKCLRTDDIDDVGDSVHNTFFEMLGNWSLGDPASPARSAGSRRDSIGLGGYWKKEAISWSYQFLIDELKLDPKRIYISVFAGDKDAPFDEESYQIWRKLGVPENHIFKYGKDQNWWGPIGQSGPCGPDTEMFFDMNPQIAKVDLAQNPDRFVEIWNDVFMEYDKQVDGSYKPLAQKNVDTGMGLERILAVLQNVPSVYETDVFLPLAKRVEDLSDDFNVRSARIVADHLRASVFLISAGVTPSNIERGYVLRRLLRRAIRHASLLKINQVPAGRQGFIEDLAKIVVKTYQEIYPDLEEFQRSIIDEFQKEEEKFKKALNFGIRQFEKIKGDISGRSAFDLYQNFGFPIELTVELVKEAGKKIDLVGFEKEFRAHQKLSQTAGQKTKGGLAIQTDQTAKLHTATHLLHQTLRDVLGKHVHQTGSHITEERLRFDFSHHAKMTKAQIKKVEEIVNQKIKENLIVYQKNMPKETAHELSAIGLFGEKYGDLVKIYYLGPTKDIAKAYSKEFCGGPHAKTTGELANFKIIKEESLGSGVRRIYATISG